MYALNYKGDDSVLGRIGPDDIVLTEEEWIKRQSLMTQIRRTGGTSGAGLRPPSERKIKQKGAPNVLVGNASKKKIAVGRGNFLGDLSSKLSLGPKKH